MTKELSPLQRSFKRINELLPDSDQVLLRCDLYTFAYEQKNVPEHCFINSCMWAYHSAISSRDEHAEPCRRNTHCKR